MLYGLGPVIPAGRKRESILFKTWIPAFAGMTKCTTAGKRVYAAIISMLDIWGFGIFMVTTKTGTPFFFCSSSIL